MNGIQFTSYSSGNLNKFAPAKIMQQPIEHKKEEKKNSTTKKLLLGSAALAAIVLAGVALRGKLGKLGGKLNEKTQTILEGTNNASTSAPDKLSGIISEFKAAEGNYNFKDIDPAIKKLKNGKQLIEFKEGVNKRTVLVCDKSGKFENRIDFYDMGFGTTGHSTWDSLSNVSNKNLVRSAEVSKRMKDGVEVTNISAQKRYDGDKADAKALAADGKAFWQKNINVKKSDKFLNVHNNHWSVPGKDSGANFENINTTVAYKNGKPDLVVRSVSSSDSNNVTDSCYQIAKNGQKVKLDSLADDSPFKTKEFFDFLLKS